MAFPNDPAPPVNARKIGLMYRAAEARQQAQLPPSHTVFSIPHHHRERIKAYNRLNIFTIVLNGMPFISQHITELFALQIPWHWSIVHGLADPVADTAWCKRLESVPDDGTLDYLHDLVNEFPEFVSVHRAERWPGKTVMCNAAIKVFEQPGILLEMDVDEFWTTAQLEIMPNLFSAYPEYDHAYFFCRYFVGPKRVITQPDAYANNTKQDWMRAWCWSPGMQFARHEPPRMVGQDPARTMPHILTAAAGLNFEHRAWVTEEQVAFKEAYYGYKGAVAAWKKLNAMSGPQDISEFLPWVRGRCMSYEVP